MKNFIKRTLSLALAALMVLAMIPAMPLAADAADFTPGGSWVVEPGFTDLIRGAFTPADDDFIYEADETVNWKSGIESAVAVDGLIGARGYLTYNGQTIMKELTSLSIERGGSLQLFTPANFPEVTADMYGNFELVVQVYHKTTLAATGTLNFVRNAPATEPEVTEPETTVPAESEPAEVEPVTMAGFHVNSDNSIVWADCETVKSYGAAVHETYHMFGINKDGYATFAVSEAFLTDFNGKVTVEVEYATAYGTNFTFAYTDTTGARKDAVIAETKEGSASNTAIAVYNIEDAGFNGTLLKGGEAFGILANNTTGIKGVVITKVVEETPEEPTDPSEPEEPEEPEVPAAPTNPGEVVWQYGKTGEGESYAWLTGAIATAHTTGIYKGWEPYDWAITLSPTKATATVTVEAQVEDHTGAVIANTTKTVDVTLAPSVTSILTAADLGLSNKTLGNFRVTAVIKYTNPETSEVSTVAQVQAVFGRRIGDVGTTAVEYKDGNEWINGAFSATDEDLSYVGEQPYDWSVTVSPIYSAPAITVTATVVNEQGEVVATLTKENVQPGRAPSVTTILTADELTELTADLYGKFAVTCVCSADGVDYVGVYGVFERVEGVWVAPTDIAPEFTPVDWNSCEYPAPIEVVNNGEMAKKVSVNVTISDAQGQVAALGKTVTLAVGASEVLATGAQINGKIQRGVTYTVTITGYWTVGYGDIPIDVSFSYTLAEHTDTEVIPGYDATCTETGMTDGTWCNGCQYTIVEQEEIPVDPEAHNFVDGTCANGCGAVEEPEIVKVDFIAASQVIMGNNMDMMFAINKSIVSDWTGYYAEIVHIYADGRENDVQRIYSEDFGTSGKYYTVTYKGLAAKEMCDKLIVTIYNEKGQAVSNDWVDSLKEYAQRNYNVTTNLSAAKLAAKRTMIVDMLNYGAAAQIKAGYGLDLLANAGLTPEQQAVGTQEVTLESNVNNTHMASQLMLESNISFWIAIKNLDETMSAKIEYTDYLGKTKVESISGENFGISGSVRYVASTQVVMADAYQVLNITIYNADGSIFTTTQDSIQAYLARSIDKATEENKPLYEGIMKFATSARTYLLTD